MTKIGEEMNIVFDLGAVVFNWQPDEIVEKLFTNDQELQNLVRNEVFKHPDWIELDRGILTQDVAIKRAQERSGLTYSAIEKVFKEVPLSLVPLAETRQLLDSIKNSDNNFYILSNMHVEFIDHLERENEFLDMFDGRVISCRINKVKPEKDIYEHLLNEFDLIAHETVFIDDMEENVQAASELGIQTIHFSNAQHCESELRRMNFI